jgi:glycosyltransferase involved in cell wall biosynthesis
MTPVAAPLRVLMTIDAVGGVWHYATTLVEALARLDRARSVEFLLACIGPAPSIAQQRAVAALPRVRLVHRPYRLEWMDDPWDDVARAGRWLGECAADFRPDLVHLNGYVHAALQWRVPVLVVGHSCVLSWWEAVRGEPAPAACEPYRRAVARGLAHARSVVAPTHAMLSALERHYGLPEDRHVISNGAFLARFAPGVKEAIVMAAGRVWDEGKNLAALDAAARNLSWPVYVAGDARHPSGGAVVARSYNALGALPPDRLRAWIARAMIYALPARYEPFGLSALEAAAAGCALVLGDIPSLREVWGDAAVFVDPDRPMALSAAIAGLMDDPARRELFATRASARARRFSAERMARRYAEIYADLAPLGGGLAQLTRTT